MTEVEFRTGTESIPSIAGRAGRAAGIDEEQLGASTFPVGHRDRLRPDKTRFAEDQVQPVGVANALFAAAAEAVDDVALALAHARHVDEIGPVCTP